MMRGTVDKIIFAGEEAFIIAVFRTLSDERPTVTIKGNLWGVDRGDEIEVEGEEIAHPKFGMQINVRTYRFINPKDHQKQIEESIRFLKEELGLKKRGDDIFKAWGGEAKSRILKNPYELAQEVSGIGFKIADEIATKLGIEDHDARRVDECVLHTMRLAADGQGHVFLGKNQLVRRVNAFLGDEFAGAERVEAAIGRLLEEKTVGFRTGASIIAKTGRGGDPIYYLPKLYEAETEIVQHLEALIAEEPVPLTQPDPEDLVGLSEEQQGAVLAMLRERFLVITGGPGTGKTHCLKALVDVCNKWNIDITLCAPTGRAAKRMQEATGHDAFTIHRALGYNPRSDEWPAVDLPSKIVVCDEASMLDIEIAQVLLRAKPGGSVIFVGDVDQLEPVGPGAFFKDLVQSGLVPVVRLTRNYRQEAGLIVNACKNILDRTVPTFGRDPKTEDLFRFSFGDGQRGAEMIVGLVTRKIPETFGIPAGDIQVLCPNHDGATGRINLNRLLQSAIQGKTGIDEHELFIGDRVIQKKNDHERYVMNGDVGVVRKLLRKGGAIIDFGGTEYEYDEKAIRKVDLAYAISIHSGQGSEYPAVVIVAHSHKKGFLTRNMLYTAVSRGKKLVVVVNPVGSMVFEAALSTDERPRNSRMLDLLKGDE